MFDAFLKKTLKEGSKTLSGDDVWRLYDTYGFPVDLTRIMAEENNVTVDEKQFEAAQEAARNLSRNARGGKGGLEAVALDVHDLGALEKNDAVPKTDDSSKYRKKSQQSGRRMCVALN
jgi:alanyl-tRNA synthetase